MRICEPGACGHYFGRVIRGMEVVTAIANTPDLPGGDRELRPSGDSIRARAMLASDFLSARERRMITILFVAVLPVMFLNLRNFRRQAAM